MHLELKRERTLRSWEREAGRTEEVVFRVQDAFFTTTDSRRLASMSHGLWALFLSSQLAEETEVDGDMFFQHFVVPPQQFGTWAHQTLITTLSLGHNQDEDDDPGFWRQMLRRHEFPFLPNDLREEANAGFSEGITQYVFDVRPDVTPAFLNPRDSSSHERSREPDDDDL